MKNKLRKVGQTIYLSPYFLLLVLSAGAFRPILGNRAPIADDYTYHLLRLAQLRHMVEQGVLFSRWMPDLAQGYGYPLFNYFAPLSYYLTLPFIFITNNVATGFQLALASGIILSGWTMYLFMRDHVQPAAAIVAAVAYMYAPYYSYDVLFRANIGEAMGFFWMPLALWGIGRVAKRKSPHPQPLSHDGRGEQDSAKRHLKQKLTARQSAFWLPLLRERAGVRGSYFYIAITAIAYAAIILTHNVFALIFSPLLGLYGLLCLYIKYSQFTIHNSQFSSKETTDHKQQPTHFLSSLLPVFLSLTLGLTLSSFFWLPAIYEQSKAAFDRLYGNPAYIYSNNYLTIRELFAWPSLTPTDLINPSPPPSLGAIPILIAALSLLLIWRATKQNRPKIIFFTLITLLIITLVLPFSDALWQLLPLLQIIQFPWRLLAIGALTVSILCGFSAELLSNAIASQKSKRTSSLSNSPFTIHHSQFSLFLLLLALIITAQPTLSPAYTPKSDKTIADIIPWENATQTLGTTVAGEYLPNTVIDIPYGKPQHIISDPIGYIAERASSTPLHHSMTLQTDVAQTITVNQFAFDGWRAYVNDQSVPITPSDPNGLITFPIDLGVQTLRVEFRETPFRLTLDILSALSLLLCIGMLIYGNQQGRSFRGAPLLSANPPIVAPLLIIALISAVILPAIRPQALNSDFTLKRSGNLQPVVFANAMELLGGEVADGAIPANQPIPITLYWRVQQTPTALYEATIALRDQTGALYSSKTNAIPRRARLAYPTNAWQPDQYAQQQALIEPIAGIPSDEYDLVVTLFDKDSLQPIPAVASVQTEVAIGRIQLTNPSPQLTTIPNPQSTTLTPSLTLIGHQLDRTSARPGDAMLVTLYWQADAPTNLTPTLHLSSDSDPTGAQIPLNRSYSFDSAGQYQTRHTIRLPATLQTAIYSWAIQAADEPPSNFATMSLDAPERLLQPPPVDTILNAPAGFASLHGYDVTQSDESIELKLVWQGIQETTTSYRVFVHLLDENENMVAQSDGEPASWTRPTTGWIRGEYVVDEHELESAENATTLRIGFYDPTTGQRPADPITIPLNQP